MNHTERCTKIARFVQDRLERMADEYPSAWHDPLYRWEHTLRVASDRLFKTLFNEYDLSKMPGG